MVDVMKLIAELYLKQLEIEATVETVPMHEDLDENKLQENKIQKNKL